MLKNILKKYFNWIGLESKTAKVYYLAFLAAWIFNAYMAMNAPKTFYKSGESISSTGFNYYEPHIIIGVFVLLFIMFFIVSTNFFKVINLILRMIKSIANK